MSDSTPFGFGKFVPGFDFLQNLASSAVKGGVGAGASSLPGLSNWVAPTLSVEELDRRIDELKTVQFWLDQNSRALSATVQALEVQKMTLATLKGMNLSVAELAKAFQIQPGAASTAAAEEPAPAAPPMPDKAAAPAAAEAPAPEASAASASPAPGVVDPMQWWGSLTQQFQQIATHALQEAAASAAAEPGRNLAADMTRQALDAAAKTVAAASPARKTPAKKAPAAATAPAAAKKAAARKRPKA